MQALRVAECNGRRCAGASPPHMNQPLGAENGDLAGGGPLPAGTARGYSSASSAVIRRECRATCGSRRSRLAVKIEHISSTATAKVSLTIT